MNAKTERVTTVSVELFGRARAVAGARRLDVALPPEAGLRDLAAALSSASPALKGVALDDDGAGFLSSYTANLNGMTFMTAEPMPISPGDSILIFSSQAGG